MHPSKWSMPQYARITSLCSFAQNPEYLVTAMKCFSHPNFETAICTEVNSGSCFRKVLCNHYKHYTRQFSTVKQLSGMFSISRFCGCRPSKKKKKFKKLSSALWWFFRLSKATARHVASHMLWQKEWQSIKHSETFLKLELFFFKPLLCFPSSPQVFPIKWNFTTSHLYYIGVANIQCTEKHAKQRTRCSCIIYSMKTDRYYTC